MDYSIIYRSCDRPRYVEKTLPLLIERSSENMCEILVVDNSTRDGRRAECEAIISECTKESPKVRLHSTDGERIGGPNAVVEGVQQSRKNDSNIKAIMVVDDDVIVPEPTFRGRKTSFWDEVLIEMLNAGWSVVGHPWANDFRRGKDPIEIGGVKGYQYNAVAGGCSAFRLSFYDKNPIRQTTLIRGYNEWMVRFTDKKSGYSHNGNMTFEHIDRPDHPLSLRDTEYDEWSNTMWYERFPKKRGQPRPKGNSGSW